LLILFNLSAVLPNPDGDSNAATELLEEFWSWRLQRSPEFATLTGNTMHNDQLEMFTEERFEEDYDSCQGFLERAENLYETIEDPGTKLNLRFFIAELETFINGYPYRGFYYPMNFLEGVQVDFVKLTSKWPTLDTVKDYEDVIARYRKFFKLAEQIVTMMRSGMERKMTNHAISMNGVAKQCRNHLVAPRDTLFYQQFESITNMSIGDTKRLQVGALSAIETSLQPGFRLLADFIESEYISATRPGIGVSSIPGIGPDYYKALLAFHTSTDLRPQEIHQRGLDEVERIENEMKKIVKEMGYDLSLRDFTKMIRNDPNNYYETPEALIAGFKDIVENRIQPRILEIFHNKPATKLEIVRVPASTPDAAAAYYIAGTADGKRPGRFFVNTNKFEFQPKYEMVSLTLHETVPGHHLQSSYMIERKDWPSFRKSMEDRIYAQSPSRFPINTAYTEGWGLYSEALGYDLGLYSDPLDRYGHLSEEIFRACRLVVDTGMHALGWTREEANQFMLMHTAASKENIWDEVDRYITWPGQATAYKIGQMKIRELRTRAETELGDKFDIKDFHEVVLQSAGPLSILEEQVDRYINTNK